MSFCTSEVFESLPPPPAPPPPPPPTAEAAHTFGHGHSPSRSTPSSCSESLASLAGEKRYCTNEWSESHRQTAAVDASARGCRAPSWGSWGQERECSWYQDIRPWRLDTRSFLPGRQQKSDVVLSRTKYSASPASLRLVLLRSSLHSLCDSPRYTLLTSYFFLDSRRLCARSESVSRGRPLQRLSPPFSRSLAWSASKGTSNSARLCAIFDS
ncbi:hypothetical protein EYF80_049116 [Liparis tanakae]|uniref:Uncharacterized protein n=1 Tax=Liparis tanakae TaxID=230148 RepID=A0A4Z2FHM9_9TELE|nr:hypothetical protein EYF80_049116 [Liparis tanakae]